MAGGTISGQPVSISFFPAAWIIGTNGGVQGDVQLATNHIVVATSDVIVGAPAAQYQISGYQMKFAQNTQVDGGHTTLGMAVEDNGPGYLTSAYIASNNGIASNMFTIAGGYDNVFNMTNRPANNGCILCVAGNEPVSSNAKPYLIFEDHIAGSSLVFSPSANTYTFGNGGGATVIAASFQTNLGVASAFSTGTTIGGHAVCLVTGTNCPSVGIPTTPSNALVKINGAGGAATALFESGGVLTTTDSLAVGGGLGVGSSPPTACSGLSGCGAFAEAGTSATATAGVDTLRADSSHLFKVGLNGGSEFTSLMNFSVVNLASSAAGGVTGNLPLAQVPGAAPLASPTFTGIPTAPTATLGTNNNQIATTAFVAASTYLSGTTGSIGGSLLAGAGSCVTGTATVPGVGAGNFPIGSPVAVAASDGSLPNGLVTLSAAATGANTVTVSVCAIAAVTPAAKTYNVSVF